MSKVRRTEDVTVHFVDRQAAGWVFGVSDAFRMHLDITLDERIDKDANKRKEEALGRKLEPSEKIKRSVWTQGIPPAYAFDRGHVFHEPPTCHFLPWSEARLILKRSVTVLLSKPDAGALVTSTTEDEETSPAVVVPDVEHSGGGWVDYAMLTYEGGVLIKREESSRSQAAFVELLRTGV